MAFFERVLPKNSNLFGNPVCICLDIAFAVDIVYNIDIRNGEFTSRIIGKSVSSFSEDWGCEELLFSLYTMANNNPKNV